MFGSSQSSTLQSDLSLSPVFPPVDLVLPADVVVPAADGETSDTAWDVATQVVQPAGAARVAMSEIVSALSFALDLTEDAVPGHALRSCLLGMRIGRGLGLGESELADLYYALLLKDVGCSSNSARMCEILGSDERKAKKAIKTVDWTDSSLACAQWAWKHALPGAGPLRKIKRMATMKRNGKRNNQEMFLARCDRGAQIARKIGVSQACADGIGSLDEHWNGAGFPYQRAGTDIPLYARILAIAQHLDAFGCEHGRGPAIHALTGRSGTWFDPDLVRLATSLHRAGGLWVGWRTPDERDRVMELEPGSARTLIGAEVDRICEAFADVVDAKSPFTYRHSIGVMEAADGIASQLAFCEEKRRLIHRAALLHDLGKLSVPNTILDKPLALSEPEWAVVREHPRLSQEILGRIPSFAQIAVIAGRHHERLDGSGYPHGLRSEDLTLEDRMIAMADVYGTLSEERPYRPAMPDEQILGILRQHTQRRLDVDCFEGLQLHLEEKHGAGGRAKTSRRRGSAARSTKACGTGR